MILSASTNTCKRKREDKLPITISTAWRSSRATCRSHPNEGHCGPKCTSLRVIGFERRVTVAFFVDGDRVKVLRIFVGGQNWQDILEDK